MPDSPPTTTATSSIATSNAVNLSDLPPPVIIAQPDYETRRADKLARLTGLLPAFDQLVESDPAVKLIEADSFDEQILVAQFSDAARGLLLAFAAGAQLDHLGALFGVTRLTITRANAQTGAPAVLESDDAFRDRILLAPSSFSVAGPELAYVYHARTANSDVVDASATSPAPGQVLVSLLARSNVGNGDGTASAQMIADVTARVNDDAVRPLTDQVTVAGAQIVPFNIIADIILFAGPDGALIMQTARDALDKYLADNRRIGRDINRAGIIAALKVAGTQNIILQSPAADIVIDRAQAAHAASITITNSGIAD